MKKSLIAIAATLAVSGAYAQSDSVTVYGLIDYGYLNKTVTNNGFETNQNGIAANTAAQTRLGFKGHESLGGGNSAHFVLELGLDPSADAKPFTVRQGYVALGNDKFGKLSVGRQQTFTYNALAHADASGIAKLPGSVFYNRVDELDRANMVSYSVGNDIIAVRASYASNQETVKDKQGNNVSADTHAYELGTKLTYDKLSGHVAYTNAHIGDSKAEPVYGYSFSRQGDAKTGLANVSYDFGVVKLGYTYYVLVADGKANVVTAKGNSGYSGTLKATVQEIGVTVPVTSAVELFGNYGIASLNVNGAKASGNGFQAGGRYNLSKRTSIYAAYGQQQAKAPYDYKETAYTAGLKHTF